MKKRDFHVRKTILKQKDLDKVCCYARVNGLTISRAIKELIVKGFLYWSLEIVKEFNHVQRKEDKEKCK